MKLEREREKVFAKKGKSFDAQSSHFGQSIGLSCSFFVSFGPASTGCLFHKWRVKKRGREREGKCISNSANLEKKNCSNIAFVQLSFFDVFGFLFDASSGQSSKRFPLVL